MPVNLNNINRGISVQAPVQEQGNWLSRIGGELSEHIFEPIDIGWGALAATLTPWNMPGEQAWRERMAQGQGWYQAGKETYEELPSWAKVVGGLTNPAYYIPVAGWGAKAGRAIGGVAKGAELGGRVAETATGLSKISPTLGKAVTSLSAKPYQLEQLTGRLAEAGIRKGLNLTGVAGASRKLTTTLDKRFADRLNSKLNTIYEHTVKLPEVAGEMTHEQVFKAITAKPNLATSILREVTRIPVAGKPVKMVANAINNRILSDELSRHVMAEDYLFGARGNNVVELASELQAAGNPRRLFGLGSEPLTSANAKNNVFARNVTLTPAGVEAKASTAIGDILENWKSGWYALTPEQEVWVTKYHELMTKWEKLAKEHGVDLLKYKDPEDSYHYFRMGYGKIDERTGDIVPFSKSGSPAKPRIHKTQAEGVDENVVYNADPIASAQATATWINKKIRDERISSFIKPYGKTPTEMAIARLTREGTPFAEVKARVASLGELNRRLKGIFEGFGTERQAFNKATVYQNARILKPEEIATIRELTGKDLTKALTEQAEAGTLTHDEVYQILTEARKAVTDAQGVAKASLKGLTPEYRKAVDYYKAGTLDPTKEARIIDQPMFNGRVFPKEIAESYRKGRGLPSERAKQWMTAINKLASVSRVGRTLVASMDFSAPFIQGLPALGADPIAWANATLRHYRWFFNKSNFPKYITDNKAVWDDASKYGLHLGTFEFYAGEEAIEKGLTQLGQKIGGTTGAKIGRGLPRQTLGRGEAAFSGFGDAQRLELWKSLRYRAKTPEELAELAQSINKMTGYTELLGVSDAEKLLEQTFIFAPRYTRAGFQLVGDVFQGGIRGEMAREALGHMMAGGMIWYVQACRAMGVEPNLDPTSSKFMSLRIGDQWIGIGGFMTSLIRFSADIATMSPDDIVIKAGETWDEYVTRQRKDNPFLKFMYQKSAPLVGLVTEGLTANDYMGQELENPAAWAKWLAGKTLPMAMQSLVEGDTGPAGVAAQFAGLREYPISDKEKFYDEVAKLTGGTLWKNLDKMQRRSLLLEHPELDEMKAKADKAFAIGVSGRINQEWSDRSESIEKQYDDRLKEIAYGYEAGQYSGKQFRDAVGEAEAIRRAEYKNLESDGKFAGIYQAFEDPERVNTDNQFDAALFRYRQLVWDNPDLTDEYGNYNYAEAERAKAQFNAEWPGMQAQIDQYIQLGRMGEPEAIADLRKARTTMSPYFGIKDHLLAQAGLTKTYEAYGDWVNLHPTSTYEEQQYLKDMLGLTPVLEQVSNYQKQIRENNGGQNPYNYYYMKYYS